MIMVMLFMVMMCIGLAYLYTTNQLLFAVWRLGWVLVGLNRRSINSPGSGLVWVGSRSMKQTHGQLW